MGCGRTDLLIDWCQVGRGGRACIRKYVIECKVRPGRVGQDRLIREGLEHASSYMDGCGAESGRLVISGLLPGQSWEERSFRKDPEPGKSSVAVLGR